MKKTTLLIALVALGLYGCQKEGLIEDATAPSTTEAKGEYQPAPPQTGAGHSALIIGGKAYYAGIGYSPTQDRLFAPAIDRWDMLQSTDIPKPLAVDVTVVKNNHDLEKFVRKTITKRIGGFFAKVFGFARSSKKIIEERTKINHASISVVARISVQKYRYLVSGDPFLDSRAQQLANQGRVVDFLKKYGSGYVDEQVTGGDVYYVYTYNLNKVSLQKRTNYERNIAANVKKMFGLPTNVALSNDDKRVIANSVEKYSVATNIIGFTPRLINATGQLNGEVRRIQAYLSAHPRRAAAMEMKVASYANVFQYAGFTNLYNKHIQCYQNWEKWEEWKSKVLFVHQNTTKGTIRQQAANALSQINQKLALAQNCGNSAPPRAGQYDPIINAYKNERWLIDSKAAGARTGKLSVRYDMPPILNCPSPTVSFRAMTYQYEGSVPLYRLVSLQNPNWKTYHTMYSKDQYFVENIAGYVFPKARPGTIPLSMFLLQFKDNPDAIRCVYYTTNPNQPPGRHVMIGHVFPQ